MCGYVSSESVYFTINFVPGKETLELELCMMIHEHEGLHVNFVSIKLGLYITLGQRIH
jgi:hypothetical protein